MGTSAPIMDNSNILIQYANVFIPLAISIVGGIISFVVMKEKVKNLVDDVKELKSEVKSLTKQMAINDTKLDERTSPTAALTKRKSPISLSTTGEDLLKRSGADAFVLNNKDDLVKKIKDKNPKSAYDVQEFAKEVVESLRNDERILSLKDYAFKEGLELDSIFIVMSIYLRDIALPLLGYTPQDVDSSDPERKEVANV